MTIHMHITHVKSSRFTSTIAGSMFYHRRAIYFALVLHGCLVFLACIFVVLVMLHACFVFYGN